MITYHPNATDPDNLGEALTVDFTPPFKRICMVPDLEKVLNTKLPDPSEFGTPGNDGVKHKVHNLRGGVVASWLVCLTLDRVVRVRVLAGDIVLCSWARRFTPTVPLSTQVYRWVPANSRQGVTLQWTSIPSRFGVKILLVASC